MKKFLIYGFKPYCDYQQNITQMALDSMSKRSGVAKKIFDVRFSKKMFLDGIKKHSPDVIIGLGQHPRARKIRIERKAVNLMAEPGGRAKPIIPNSESSYFANLKIPSSIITTTTYDAGTYVCNFSMYVLLDYCLKRDISFAFLHIPKDLELSRVRGCVKKIISAG